MSDIKPTRDQAPRARVPATPEAATDQLLLRQATAARTILLKMLGTKVSIDSHLYNKKQDKPIVMNFCKEAAAEAKGIQQLSESGNMQQTMSKLNSMMTLFEGQLKDSQDPDVKQVVELIRNFQDPAQLSKTSTLKESIQEATPDMANALNTLTQTYKEDMRRLEQNLDELYAWADPVNPAQPEKLQGGTPKTQRVFYFTDRKPTVSNGNGKPQAAFSNDDVDKGQPCSYGWIDVSIPPSMEQSHAASVLPAGANSEDFKMKLLPHTLEDMPEHMPGATIPEAFLTELNGVLDKKNGSNGDLVLFIHGYNTDHESAMDTAALLAYDNFEELPQADDKYGKRVVLAFDWASTDSAPLYALVPGFEDDLDRAKNAAPRLQRLWVELDKARRDGKLSNLKHIHIIAHSMGNYCLVEAVKAALAAHECSFEWLSLIATITHAAADVSRNELSDMLALLFKTVQQKPTITVYCSSTDLALTVSTALLGFNASTKAKAGYFTRERWSGEHYIHPFLHADVETIDCSGQGFDLSSGDFGHGYFRNTILLKDLRGIMQGKTPGRRAGLTLKPRCDECAKEGRFWKIE